MWTRASTQSLPGGLWGVRLRANWGVVTDTTQSALPKRFGAFEFDPRARQLRKHGHRIRLHGQPLEILGLLLEHPMEVVLREELRARLWPEDTFVDFEHSLNAAVNKLREAIGDDANSPRFIETVPRRGYRFIALVERSLPAPATDSTNLDALASNQKATDLMVEKPAAEVPSPDGARTERLTVWLACIACAFLIALFIGFNGGGLHQRLLGRPDPDAIRSLAVLPLENLSRDPEQEYFADGMAEALTTELAQISALKVISHTSVVQYKGTKKSLPQIAQELSVDAVVEGAVQRSGDKVEITVQLIHAPSDRHLWAKSYERGLRDVLALQRDVAHAIADEIKAKLTPQEQARLTTARPVNPEAHDAYLKGLYYYSVGHDEADRHKYDQLLKSSIEYFSQATRMDPNYAPAYAGMAIAYDWQSGSDRKVNLKAREAATKALQIDDTLGEAHYLLGYVALYYDWNWSVAEKELRRGIELNPSFGEAHYGYALYLNAAGRHDGAIAEIQRAQEVDPIVFIQKLDAGRIYACAGQYDRAIKQLRDAPDLKPNDSYVHEVLGDIYLYKGMQAESAAEYRKAAQLIGGNPSGRLVLAAADAVSGNRTEARAILSDLANLPEQYVDWPVHLARQYASLGEKNLAMAWLEKAYTEHSYALLEIRCARELDVLQSDPRFQDLLRRMNFPQ
jgi:TolB-like protein/DNA-binding winged helix-turn-helix (wHTH) protein/Flp pilus assembly protein TadD